MKYLRHFGFLFSFILFFSCSQSLDFDQTEAYTIKPEISASFVFFKVNAINFIPSAGSQAITEVIKIIDFNVFESNFIKENTVKLDFEFEVKNEFNRNISIEISLLDANNNLMYKFKDLKINANNLNFKQKEIINIATNQNLKNFTRVLFTTRLEGKSVPIVVSNLDTIEFKSAFVIHLEKSF
jgi:hypothetical protein